MRTWKNLGKRGLSAFLAVVMCLGMLNLTVFAADEDGHVHSEGGWSCTQDEPVRELTCDTHVHGEDCYQHVLGELTCAETEHAHGDGCYAAGEDVLDCQSSEHTHSETCLDRKSVV